MKFETVKNYKKILLIAVVFFLLAIVLIIRTSLAKYKNTESIPLVRGTINYSLADLNVVALYQENESGEYVSIDEVPTSGYTLNETESYCEVNTEKDESITIEYSGSKILVDNITKKGIKCYVYFDEISYVGRDTILANKTISERTDFSTVYTTETTGTLYTAKDDDGTSYYYAGAATDNYVSFAGFYWRIIRINGDGSIRMIYDGTTARTNGTSSSATQIGTSYFNSNYDNNMYVGYMYTNGSVDGLGISSTIKGTLDDWFTSNLSDYTSYLDYNVGFCGDGTAYTDNAGTTSGTGIGTTQTYYGAYIRLATNKVPDLKCADSSDLYTTENSDKGNKALTYPVGLITADEVAYAGGVWATNNTSYYLYTGQYYWTMSPFNCGGGSVAVFLVSSSSGLYHNQVNNKRGVRPVINLKASVEFSGSGTSSDAYVPVSY